MAEINLGDLTAGGEVRNLTAHERGVAARVHYGLDQLDIGAEVVTVIVPPEIFTLTPSFFQGMFAESVRHFGSRESFLQHYSFDASNLILKQIDRGISASQMRRGELLSA
ncbi:MAG: hypothetical protein QOJ15_10797 [Bradyrhizobium sp.]|jgi:hypothetical protein|nr:hypothetical protein [Bradyrhizobium sp.]